MAHASTTGDRIWGSVTDERDQAFMATVALFPHGLLWYYAHAHCVLGHKYGVCLHRVIRGPTHMDTTNQPLPHLALRAAKKLNPKLQCWRWNEGWSTPPGFFNRLDDYEGAWVPVGTPKWLPHCIYAVTGSKKEKPSWAPSPQASAPRSRNVLPHRGEQHLIEASVG